MNKAVEQGYELEEKIHNELLKIKSISHLMRENEMVRIYGKETNGIDHLIFVDKYFITIQDKWESETPQINSIDHLIITTNIVKGKTERELLCSLFVSKMKMSSTGLIHLQNENEKYTDDKYYAISSIDMDMLVNKTIEFIKNRLIGKGLEVINDIDKIILRDDQIKDIDAFVKRLLEPDGLKTGIGVKPTGGGKTIVAIASVGEFFKKYKRSVMWITERIDVLKSQFDDQRKLIKCIYSGLLPGLDKYYYLAWYNKTADIDYLNKLLEKNDKPVFLIINSASLLYNCRYKKILNDKFGLILADEVHWFGAEQRYEFALYVMNNWINLKAILGFSATPLRPEKESINRIKKIFGDGKYVYFISMMSFIDAIDKGIIVPPEYYWIETKLDKNISLSDFNKGLNLVGYESMLKHIEHIVGKSVTKKGIFWDNTIDNIKQWREILNLARNDKIKYPNLSEYKFFITYSGIIDDEIDEFILYVKPAVLLAVEKGKEGFDDPMIDFCGNLGAVKDRSILKAQQQAGRALRTYSNLEKNIVKRKGIIFDCFCFDNEEDKIMKVIYMLSSYIMLLKNVESIDESFDPDKYYNMLMNMVDVNSDNCNIKLKLNNTMQIIFNILSTELKKLDWINIPDKIREEIKNRMYDNGITCKKAMEIIRYYIVKENKIFDTKEQYFEISKIDARLPMNPDEVYPDFPGWIEYLQIDKSKYYLTSLECKKSIDNILRTYDGINKAKDNLKEIYEFCRLNDDKIPPLLSVYYKTEKKRLEDFINLDNKKVRLN